MADLTQTALQTEPSTAAITGTPRAGLTHFLLSRWANRLARGALEVHWPDGLVQRHVGDQSGPTAQIHINNSRVVRRVAFGGAVGLADAYVDGDWDSPDIAAVLSLGVENESTLVPAVARRLPVAAFRKIRHRLNANTRAGSRRNIAAHYDLGNVFYGAWLDDSMTYSAGLFSEPEASLADAQAAKYMRVAELAGIQHGDHVLEIGCGWGGFAIYAARQLGCRVTALTVSRAQAEWARSAVASAGLSDHVAIRLQDYRDVDGKFDRIVSIEMFEAVGESYWSTYFNTLRNSLRPGGKAALQVITIDDARFAGYRRKPDFIQLRVFPGGMLPSSEAFASAVNEADLVLTDTETFGPCYAETLRRWRSNFETAWPTLEPLGFDTEFRRLWRYYLGYCEAGFDAGTISVAHYGLQTG